MSDRMFVRAQSGIVQHPLAARDATGHLRCKACDKHVGMPALWTTHLLSAAHKSTIESLRQQAASTAASSQTASASSATQPDSSLRRSAGTVVPKNATPDATPSQLPLGFFDDAALDARAHGQDLATLQRASESAALHAFLGDLSESGQGGKAAQAAWLEETAAAEARADAAQSEHALYKARLSLWKDGIDPRMTKEDEGEEVGAGALIDELAPTGSGMEAQAMVTQAIGKRQALLLGGRRDKVEGETSLRDRARAQEQEEEEDEEDVMDWRRKRVKR